ncbi:MAG: hypothetical protein AAGB30_11235 [Pedobacter sp.]|nr:hypothetical protein [Pedobacter sp.]
MIVDIEKRPTWTSKIEDLNIGQHFHAPLSKRMTIASLISGMFKLKYPRRVYETNKVELDGQEVLKVTRMEDRDEK